MVTKQDASRPAKEPGAARTEPDRGGTTGGSKPVRWICGTPKRPTSALRFAIRAAAWDRRTFRYAFGALPGSSGTLPQTLGLKDVEAAVEAACAEWSTADVELGFAQVGLDENPHIIIEWVPDDHSEQAKQDTNGSWILSDDTRFSKGDGSPPSYAHADFPPKSASGDAGVQNPAFTQDEPPISIHFNDEGYTWTKFLVETVVLHELGHNLGLDDVDGADLDGENAVMEGLNEGLVDLQKDDRNGIRKLYGVPGPERFNWIWMEGTHRRTSLRAFKGDDLDAEIARLKKEDGFRIGKLNAYVLPTGTLYNAVFDQLDQQREYARDMSRQQFDAEHTKWRGQGLKLIDVTTFVNAGGVRFNGVWGRVGEDIRAHPGITLSDLKGKLDKAKKDGDYRPTLINGYETPDGEQRWNLLLIRQGHAGPPREWEARVALTRAEFNELSDELEEQYDHTCIHALVLDGGREQRWSAIWEEIHVPSRRSWDWVRLDFNRHTKNLEKQVEGLQVWDVNAFVRPPAPKTTTLASLDGTPVGQRAVVLGLAIGEQHVYAARYHQLIDAPSTPIGPGVLVVLDRQTLQPVPGLPQFPGLPRGVPVGYGPCEVALNPVTGKLFVVNRGKQSYSLSVIDGNTLKVQQTIMLGATPTHVAVNAKTNRVYVSNLFQQRIHVIDGATLQPLAPIEIGPGPGGLAVDETTNTLYVALADHAPPQVVNGLGVVIDEPGHREILPIVPINPIGIDSLDVAVDPAHDRVYVVNQGNAGTGPPSVTVVHRKSLNVLATVPLPKAARNIALNSDARELYVTSDDGNVYVIDAVTLTVARVILTGPGPWAIEAAGGTARQVYVGDRRNGSVTRLI